MRPIFQKSRVFTSPVVFNRLLMHYSIIAQTDQRWARARGPAIPISCPSRRVLLK